MSVCRHASEQKILRHTTQDFLILSMMRMLIDDNTGAHHLNR